MKLTPSMRLRHGGIWAALVVALSLSACGGKEEAPPPAQPSAPVASEPVAATPEVVDESGGEAMVIQPSLVDTLSIDELLVRADEAVKERQLFVPIGESAFEMYLRVVEQEPVQVRARNALSDLFPYAVLYVEQRTAAGDLAESERVLDLMERADSRAPALPRLQRGVDGLRDRVAAEAQREAQRLAAQAAAAAAPAPVSTPTPAPAPTPTPEPVATAPSSTQPQTPATQPESTPVAAVPTPAPVTPPPPQPVTPPPAAAPVAPTVISAVQPRYPPVALRRRVEGSVEVGFTIMPDGSVSNVRVLSSRPNNTFDREAINAMERWRFTPPGRQVESRRVFDFKLSE
ncbi:TonB family protein [Xanthomonadaceae bacterium JHOS43]|nr:TonB family protein [Xanthomonadaceae bacterium JHOS43]